MIIAMAKTGPDWTLAMSHPTTLIPHLFAACPGWGYSCYGYLVPFGIRHDSDLLIVICSRTDCYAWTPLLAPALFSMRSIF